jgi:DNA-binding CsgD family transcriptional regulator
MKGKIEDLTPREREVLLLTSRGLIARQIASQLGVSVKCVGNWRTKINRKLGDRYTQRVSEGGVDSITGTEDDFSDLIQPLQNILK